MTIFFEINRPLIKVKNILWNCKGQLISKANCQAEDSSKKRTNEFVFTSMRRVFVRFFEESLAIKKTFRDYLTFRCTPNVAKSHPAINYWTFSASVNKKKVPSGVPGWSVFRQENGRTLKVLTHKPNIITSQTQQPLQIFFTASCSIRYNLME